MTDLLRIEERRVAAGDDSLRGLIGDETCPRLRDGQCALRVEHSLQPGAAGDGLPNLSGTKIGPKRSSDIEERGLVVALEVDVELERAVHLAGDERRARRRVFDGREQRV